MILYLLAELERKIESMFSLTEGASEDMSKQDLLMIIRNLSDRIEQADKDVKIILKNIFNGHCQAANLLHKKSLNIC